MLLRKTIYICICHKIAIKIQTGDLLRKEKPLDGYYIVVKDNINVRGFQTSAGTKALKDYRPTEDAPVVQKLKDAGAVVIGALKILFGMLFQGQKMFLLMVTCFLLFSTIICF